MNEKILIIDSHPVYIYKLEGFLRGLTYKNILLARSGKEGIERLELEKPVLVILSGMLPDMNSPELCQIIKEKSTITKVIVQIGLFTDKAIIEKFNESGADAILARKEKYFQLLQDTVEKLINSSRALQSR